MCQVSNFGLLTLLSHPPLYIYTKSDLFAVEKAGLATMTLEADGATDRPVCSVTLGLIDGGDRPLREPAEKKNQSINPLMRNGLSHPYHSEESIFILRGFRSDFFFISFFTEIYKQTVNRRGKTWRPIWGYSVCLCPIRPYFFNTWFTYFFFQKI